MGHSGAEEGELSSYSITMAPRVAKGKVFIGNAGGEFPPFRGYVSAFDVDTGKELWKFHVTPGDPAKGFENRDMQAAAKTWAGRWWEQGGGGSLWDGMAYDPDENLLYFGTGNGAVWSSDLRNGGAPKPLDNLYIASIVAVDADTGRLKCITSARLATNGTTTRFQHLVLADIRINNRTRKVIMQANKNGYFYVIDRRNGEFISAAEMSQVSWATGIDQRRAGPAFIPTRSIHRPGARRSIGADDNTSQMSFNPNTGLICADRRREHVQLRCRRNLHADSGTTELRTHLRTQSAGARGGTPMATRLRTDPDRRNRTAAKCAAGFSARDPRHKGNVGSH